MAMIRALWDTAYGRNVPDFKEDPYDLGSFDEIANYRGGRSGRADVFEAGFDASQETAHRRGKRVSANDSHYRFNVTFTRNGTVPVPVKRHLSNEDVWIEDSIHKDQSRYIRFGTDEGAWEQEAPDRELWPLVKSEQIFPFFLPFGFLMRREGAQLTLLQGTKQPTKKVWGRLDKLIRTFRKLGSFGSQRPYASAPVRSKPRRTYDTSRFAWVPEGDYIPIYLANLHFQNKEQWADLRQKLEKFGQASGLFDEILVKPLGTKESGPFQVQVRKFGSKVKGPQRNLTDVGYGVSQVLPVIIELLQKDASLFLLQQPEVHLHPSAQAALATFFCEIAKPNRQLVVETHSDHLLDRVRMDIRDGTTKLKPDDVSILFFERDNLDVKIHSLRLDKEGNILNAPPSYRKFFMEETRRSLGL